MFHFTLFWAIVKVVVIGVNFVRFAASFALFVALFAWLEHLLQASLIRAPAEDARDE